MIVVLVALSVIGMLSSLSWILITGLIGYHP
jgi:hypothetical protein